MGQYTTESAVFGIIEELKTLHLRDSIISTLPEKSDKAILYSWMRLTTFEKPDQAICLQDQGVRLGFISDLNAFISLRSKSKPAFKRS